MARGDPPATPVPTHGDIAVTGTLGRQPQYIQTQGGLRGPHTDPRGVVGEKESGSRAALRSLLHYWGCGAARKSRGDEFVMPHEQQLSLGAGHEIPGETTHCELANLVPVAEKREVEKGEMLPGTSWGAHHLVARAVLGSSGQVTS